MKKNCNGLSYKRYLLPTLIIFVIVGSIVSYSYGEEEEKNVKWGFSVFGGTGDAVLSKIDMKVYGLIPRVTLPLYKNWKKWDLEFEGNFFYYDIHEMHDVYFLGLSSNFVFKPIQERWGSLFLLIGGGLGYDSAGERLHRGSNPPLLGDQHFAGFGTGGLGVLLNIGRGKALRVEYRFYHISEPFDTSDRGLNTHNVLLGISF
ncbi:MAG: hypothetical protein ACXU9P_13190 [Thermodesulfobacteriota bacterium]